MGGVLRLRALAIALAVALVGTCIGAPRLAFTQPNAAESVSLARQAAGEFKATRFLRAARAFEKAYRLNPIDPRNLRYSGRAWQEVGHWERALNLLKRYAQLETNATYRLSIQPRIRTLQKKTARQRAERLAIATVKYPQGQLEIEAAQSLERLGERTDLKRALKLYETARLWAVAPAQQVVVNTSIDRLKTKLMNFDKPKTVTPVVPTRAKKSQLNQAPESDVLSAVLFVVGGVVTIAGAGLGAYAYIEGQQVDEDYREDQSLTLDQATYKTRESYLSAHDSAQERNRAGYVIAGVGAGVLVLAIVRTATRTDHAGPKTTWWVNPSFSTRGAGLMAGLRF